MPVDYFLPDAGKVIWQMETIKTFLGNIDRDFV